LEEDPAWVSFKNPEQEKKLIGASKAKKERLQQQEEN